MKQLSLGRIWTPRTYDRIAKRYDTFSWLVSPVGENAQKRVLKGLPSGSILDVGCGTGTLLALAGANGHRCYGVDTSAGMLDQARTKVPSAHLTNASFYDLPFPENFFDLVVETNALGGVEIDVPRALGEMLRVCKPGGRIRIADYAVPSRETWLTSIFQRVLVSVVLSTTP